MSVRSVLKNVNKVFMICGVGSINYSKSNFKTSVVFYVLRCILIYLILYVFYSFNAWVMNVDKEMSEPTSFIFISCLEIYFIARMIYHIWRIFLDNQLSIVLTKLEAVHEKLIRLKVVGSMKIKMNFYFIIGMIVYCAANIIPTLVWMIIQTGFEKMDVVFWTVVIVWECMAFNEYILLILYIKWMVYVINEQILQKRSCLSTFGDLYLEVIECLYQVNKSIYSLPAIVVFITGNVADIIAQIYGFILFPKNYIIDPYLLYSFFYISMKTINILILYMGGDATEKEVNRISDVLNQRSVVERNPRIKRQIKFFLLRRLHEHYHFELHGICHINLRQLHSLSSKAISYLIIQTLFKLNKQ